MENKVENKIFTKVPSSVSNIHFSNTITEDKKLNYYSYSYIYLGGGVSAGDINNDGLVDLFFSGNMVENKLYLNKGNMIFEDITKSSGLAGSDKFYTGTTMVDINGDGFLDIYVLAGGLDGNKENELYLNQGDLTFKEVGQAYNLNDSGNGITATFFDFDNDSDLDMYLGNYPITPFSSTANDIRAYMDYNNDTTSSHLFENKGGHFEKISKKAGVFEYILTLGVLASDINRDGWQDLYVSSDFISPDFLYINQKDGTFKNEITQATKHTSFYGMGIDIADYNNDLYLDIVQMDMDAASNRRAKANMASMNQNLFTDIKNVNFQDQYMHNTLQLNSGTLDNAIPKFSNVSRLAGVSSTDWSWGPLLADLDNDGWKDLFITNGTKREVNNKDYLNSLKNQKKHKDSLLQKALKIPSEPIDNYIFRNNKDLTFSKVNEEWGLSHKGFSNGSVYVDLDNDGDLDIVTNNIDEEASVFENSSSEFNNYITLKFKGTTQNLFGLGVKVIVTTDSLTQYQELTMTRGFQSSVAPELHFGLAKEKKINEIRVLWPDNSFQILKNISVNQELTVLHTNGERSNTFDFYPKKNAAPLFETNTDGILTYKHKENHFDDFKYEVLLPHKMSNFGPGLAVGDLNGDTLDDVYIGAAKGYPGGMFFQKKDGSFVQQKTKILIDDRPFEDIGATIFDADNDGDNDLYIVSGGNEVGRNDPLLQDRFYVNDGNGNFVKSNTALPRMASSGGRVTFIDYDKDGDLDLFIGGRQVPAYYPFPADSFLLENVSKNGVPRFVDVTSKVFPDLKKLGMVTSMVWMDFDNDGFEDLIVAGEWMPIKVFKNTQGNFNDVSEDLGLADTSGWWFSLAIGDFDKDGDLDFIGGNLGLNYKYKANKEETFDIYFNDFDGNKKGDIVLSYYNEGQKYPVRGRECSSQQIPLIKKKFKDYESFSTATLADVYGEDKLNNGLHYQVKSFASFYFENKNGKFSKHQLPNEAQIAPINKILVKDFDSDGNLDALIAGNLYASEVETPRADAGIGAFLKGNGKGDFEAVTTNTSGFFADGDVKDMAMIKIKNKDYIIVAKNSDFLQLIEWKK